MKDLLRYFHEAVQTVEDVELLKKKILELAVRGKLVKQDPNDEPASILLERIQEEKERLIKEKKIKRMKAVPPATSEEIPYELPNSWKWVKLGDLGQINPRNSINNNDLEVSFIPMRYIQDGFRNSHTHEKKVWGDIKKGYTHLKEKDVVVAKITPCFENRKSAVMNNLINFYGAGTTELLVFRAYNHSFILPDYVIAFVKTEQFIQAGVSTYKGTAGQQRVSKQFFENTLVPLPPLNEQKRIVSKVNELMALCDQLANDIRQKVKVSSSFNQSVFTRIQNPLNPNPLKDVHFTIEHMNDLLQTKEDVGLFRNSVLSLATQGKLVPQDPTDEPASVLLERIQKEKEQLVNEKKIKKAKPLPPITSDEIPYELPRGWEWARLGEIGEWGAGATPNRKNSDYYNGTIPWLKTGELNDGYIKKSEEKITETALKETSVRLNSPGDILIAMYGATIGKLGILEIEATTNQACCACTTFKGVYNRYLFYYLLSKREDFRNQGAGGAQPNISKEKIIITLFPLAPFEEQKQIVKKVDELMQLCDEIEQQIEQCNKDKDLLTQTVM